MFGRAVVCHDRGVLRRTVLFTSSLALLALSLAASEPFYFGSWKIVSATKAPWLDAQQDSDLAEVRALTGKTIVITANGITGPRQLACRGPRYLVKDYPADMLFQGAFGEMHARDKSADPAKIAATLGFHGSSWKTLETGCANELDFHFIDPLTTTFGLNNHVYLLKKQP